MTLKEIKGILAKNPSEEFLARLACDGRCGARELLSIYLRRLKAREEEAARLYTLYKYERELAGRGLIAGVDEAGRGPLAGPLVVAAVILPETAFLPGLNDSKQVTAKRREELYGLIVEQAVAFCVKIVSAAQIDRLNIYQATILGMRQALLQLSIKPAVALIDAMPLIDLPFFTITLIRGDSLSASIAAASILAKVTRDRLMLDMDKKYPLYGFSDHKGYGVKRHMEAIALYGPTPEHRMTFEPLKSMKTKNI